ncbi:hypothetical protein ACSSVY_000785 [Roseovarius sp. MBR-51]
MSANGPIEHPMRVTSPKMKFWSAKQPTLMQINVLNVHM